MNTKPLSLRMNCELLKRVEVIAAANGISTVDVLRICIAQGLPMVEKGRMISTLEKGEREPELTLHTEEEAA